MLADAKAGTPGMSPASHYKLLFVLTVIKMEVNHFFRQVFVRRLELYLEDRVKSASNIFNSLIFDILNVWAKYGLLDTVVKMTNNSIQVYSKAKWAEMCWERAWARDDEYWKSSAMLHRDNNIMSRVLPETGYLCWWQMADYNQGLMRMCENLVKIICRASKLKSDDPSLKGALYSVKACELCESYAPEDIFHILMQCPFFEEQRRLMYEKIYLVRPQAQRVFEENPPNVFAWLLGKNIDGLNPEDMHEVWEVSGYMINSMYTQVVKMRKGVG